MRRRYEYPRTKAEFLATIEENDDWDNTKYDEDGNAILRVGEKEEDEVLIVNPMKTHRPSKVILRSDSDPGEEFPMVVREIAMKRDGERRHASRVAAAEWALSGFYRGINDEAEWSSDEDQREVLRALAEMEVHGTGGPEGFRGGATARMSWACGLGKGRRNARGGEAWDAAIGEAFGGVVTAMDTPHYQATPEAAMAALRLLSNGHDELFVACYALSRAMSGVEENRHIDARSASSAAEEAHRWVEVFDAAAAKTADEHAPTTRHWWPERVLPPLESDPEECEPDQCIPVSDSPSPKVEILSRRGTLEGGE